MGALRIRRALVVSASAALLGAACSSFEAASGPGAGDDAGPDGAPSGADGGAASPDGASGSDGSQLPSLSPADAYRAAVLAAKPVAYWPLDDDTSASAARNLVDPGAAAVPATPRPSFGADGLFPATKAIAFDGAKDKRLAADIPFVGDKPDGGPGEFTIEAWFYPTAAPDSERRALFFQSQLDDDDIVFAFTRAKEGLGAYRYDDEGATAVPAAMPALSAWHHVVVTSRVLLWIDGVVHQGEEPGGFGSFSATAFLIGANVGEYSVRGRLAHVAVYDRALKSAEIAEHRDLGLAR